MAVNMEIILKNKFFLRIWECFTYLIQSHFKIMMTLYQWLSSKMGAQCVVARRAVLVLSQVAQGKTLIEEMFPRSGQTRVPPEARALQGVASV